MFISAKWFGTIKLPNDNIINMNNMNNAIIATIFVAMVMTTGYVSMAYVWTPSPAVLYEPAQGDDSTQGVIQDVRNRRR